MLKKRGQTWSFDLIIAVILFIVVVAVFYTFLVSKNSESNAEQQQDFAKSVSTQLVCDAAESSPYCFISKGVVDEDKAKMLHSLSYEEIRSDLGISGDFCVYMVVVDDDGNERIVPFEDNSGDSFVGVGSSDFKLTEDYACGKQVS